MNKEELKQELEEITNIYYYEKNKKDINTLTGLEKEIVLDELKSLEEEKNKIKELINIYESSNQDLIIAKLEKLYLHLICEDYDKLNEKEKYEVYDDNFPYNWCDEYSKEQKEELLLTAICDNKLINYGD